MKIVINDYAGHAFPLQLSRELAKRGHSVLHLYFVEFNCPKGDLNQDKNPSNGLVIKGISIDEEFKKYNFYVRRLQEIKYGVSVLKELKEFNPDIVVGCQNPINAQQIIQNYCLENSKPFVFWLQDIYSVAITSILKKNWGLIGWAIGQYYRFLEKAILIKSTHIIIISDDFLPLLTLWNIDTAKVTTIENWAPKDEITPTCKTNKWKLALGLNDEKIILYSGTLGLKHNPDLIFETAKFFNLNDKDVRIIVISEGYYADNLKQNALEQGLTNIKILPFQPFNEFYLALGAADVLIAMIEPEASDYSVPSKVLAYHCAGRPIVLSANSSNLSSRIINKAGSGFVADPSDYSSFINSIALLLNNNVLQAECGANARKYSDENFSIEGIANRFEQIFNDCF